MIEPDIIVSPCSNLDRPPARGRDPDADSLDRLAASLHALAFCCCELAADQVGDHVAVEPVGDHEQVHVGIVEIVGEQL